MKVVRDDYTPNTSESGNRIATENGFKGKIIFISGGTGYIGKVLIEKLLRTIPLIGKIYVLVRPKKSKDPHTRLKEIFDGPLFDLLKKERGEDILKKVIPIAGDIMDFGLGISEDDMEMLQNEVQIIFHSAATIRFDEPFSKAVLLNARGTKYMLDFAKQCKQLMVFTHVSTAYCQPNEKVLYEKAYPPPADPETVIKVVEWLGDAIENIRNQILGTYPNTYAFTKALAEDLVCQELDNLPVMIVRPSVVVPIWKEPLPGWSDKLNGPAGLILAAGKGILRSMYGDSKGNADFVPVDVVVNCLLLVTGGYLYYSEFRAWRIINCTSSFEFKVSWEYLIELGRTMAITTFPLYPVAWYPGGSMKRSRLLHNICVVLFQYLPAIILDPIIFLSGNEPVLWKVQQRITKGCEVFEYYANNTWEFNNDVSLKFRALITKEEKEIYKVDGQGIDYEEYCYNCAHAGRLYLLNEPDSTLPKARRNMKMMWAIDRLTRILFFAGLAYLLYIYMINPIFGI